MVISYNEIDACPLFELSCRDGVPENIDISDIPPELSKNIPGASVGVIAPDRVRKFLSVSFYSINNGDDKSLRIVVSFISRNFACMKLKGAIFSIALGDKELRLRLACRRDHGYTEAMLAVDLGNTRTCALVCPNISLDTSSFEMERLKLTPHYGNKVSEGLWDSLCVIGKSKTFQDVSPSFVRLGADNDLYLRDGNFSSEGIRSLSTPKRYFWDCDSDRSWCVIHPGSKDDYLLEDQGDLELAQFIVREHYAGRHPRAMILEGMIFEMLEQAERMLNQEEQFMPDAEVQKQASTQKKKYITQLAMTYPAAWSRDEVAKYREVIQRGIDCYVSQRCGDIPIQLHMKCNEATAVMVNYIYSESLRFGNGGRWLKLVGRPKRLHGDLGRSLRIGVIDIGGGTSDLAIAEVEWTHLREATNIITLYTSGTNEAGDALIARIIQDIIFEKVFDTMVQSGLSGKGREQLKTFLGREVAPKFKSLTRSFWFPLAIKFLEAIQNGVRDKVSITIYDPRKSDDQLSLGFRDFYNAFVESTDTAENVEIRNLGLFITHLPDVDSEEPDGKKNAPSTLAISFGKPEMDVFQKLLEDNFRYSPLIFGSAISAYQCDLIIWSGKTADNPAIRRLFEDQMPVPPESLISMNDYKISDRGFPLTLSSGKLSDSKLATAIGAALYSMLEIGGDRNLKISIQTEADGGQYRWGLTDANGIFQPLFDGNEMVSQHTLTYNGIQRLIIYRANSDSPLAFPMPTYEFREKPDRNIEQVNVQLELVQIDGRLDFKPVGGSYSKNGELKDFWGDAAKNDFELRIRMTDVDEIWLDSGTII